MGHAFGLLLAYALAPTLIIYFVGVFSMKRLGLSGPTITVGFFIAWFATAVVALIIAEQPSSDHAMQLVLPAALAGSIVSLICIAVAGQRKRPEQSNREEAP